jgi:ribosomal-protein-alanine N-acetyltransferase
MASCFPERFSDLIVPIMLYRLYRPGDFSQLYAVELACFAPPFRFTRRVMRQFIDCPESVTWVAEEPGQQQAGLMTGFAILNRPSDAASTVAYIQTLEVASGQRRRGIASELLRRMEASAIAAEAEEIRLHVADANTPAIQLYELRGYQQGGKEENYYAKGISARVYSKLLR